MKRHQRFKKARTDARLTVTYVAKVLRYKSHATVLSWENGTSEPPLASIEALAKLYKTTPAYLAFG